MNLGFSSPDCCAIAVAVFFFVAVVVVVVVNRIDIMRWWQVNTVFMADIGVLLSLGMGSCLRQAVAE